MKLIGLVIIGGAAWLLRPAIARELEWRALDRDLGRRRWWL